MKYEYGLSIEVSPGLWKKGALTLEAKPGETEEQLMTRTANTLEDWFRERNKHPAQEAPAGELPVINRAHERLKELIAEAPDLAALRLYKPEVDKCLDSIVMEAYIKRFNQLNNK